MKQNEFTIYTGRFADVKKMPADLLPVSIARWSPRTWKGARCINLAPSVGLLRAFKAGDIEWPKYEDMYARELDEYRDAAEIVAELRKMAARHGKRCVVLLCYCDTAKNCHRHLAAEWLEDCLKITVREWDEADAKPRHVTTVGRMTNDNPFKSMGYAWEWTCSCGKGSGGAMTRKEAEFGARRHKDQQGEAE